MLILSILVSLGLVVCWIIVLTKLFPAEGALKGILGILCGIYAFIWGWQNADRFQIKNVMIAWSILWVLSIIVNIAVRS
jgi:hypothetical protein